MPRKKDINWAIFDKEYNYLGGIIAPYGGDPKEYGDVPKDAQLVVVKRFPQHYETWDPKRGSWKADLEKKKKAEQRALVPDEKTQRWVLGLLQKQGMEISAEVMKEFFPHVEQKS